MNRFVRLILVILIAAAGMGIAVVVLANTRSRQIQDKQTREERAQMQKLLGEVSGHLRRADMVVESQEVDARRKAIRTTLLVRQYASLMGSEKSQPLRIARVVIPGDRVSVDGMRLEISERFAEEAEEFRELRGARLYYFGMIRGEQDKGIKSPDGKDSRFSFLERFEVPQLTRLRPGEARPSTFERQQWSYLWSLIPEPLEGSAKTTKNGLTTTWLPPKTITVQLERIYSAFVGIDGVSLEEYSTAGQSRLVEEMLEEGKKLNGGVR